MNFEEILETDLQDEFVFKDVAIKEFIFAQKLETIIYRGASNSRMKDFHDLHSREQKNYRQISLMCSNQSMIGSYST
jgi:hypothetical protein